MDGWIDGEGSIDSLIRRETWMDRLIRRKVDGWIDMERERWMD